jgi:hypothetical protein
MDLLSVLNRVSTLTSGVLIRSTVSALFDPMVVVEL